MSWAWQFPNLPFGLEVRTTTLVMSVAVFSVVSWRTHSWWRGFVVLAAWISAYEVIYTSTGAALGRWRFVDFLPTTGMLGWVFLALWMGHRPNWTWLGIFAVSWVVWIAFGFHANDHGLRPGPAISPLNEILNIATKTALGLAYLFGSWVGSPILSTRWSLWLHGKRQQSADDFDRVHAPDQG
jgi:hypothetical protein